MPVSSSTEFVPSSEEWTAPERPRDRIRAILAKKLMPVTKDGFDRPRATPDPSVTELVTPNAAPPSMATALQAAVEAVPGADLAQLLDSQSFCAAIMPVSPSDQDGLQSVIREFQPAPAAPGMKPNPAQGAPNAIAPSPTGTVLERMAAQAAKALDQPEPPNSLGSLGQ